MKEHPGNGVPSKVGNAGWSLTAESEWQKYAPYIFCAKSINFTYVPMDLPPLFQNTSYFEGEETQKVLPMPILGPLLIRFNFIDHQENIFKKKTGNIYYSKNSVSRRNVYFCHSKKYFVRIKQICF